MKFQFMASTFKIIEVPGHTLDHIAYYSEEQNTLFCGDTLFSGGCGRIFEGTPNQMYESLSKLSVLIYPRKFTAPMNILKVI